MSFGRCIGLDSVDSADHLLRAPPHAKARADHGPRVVDLTLRGPIGLADVPALCARLRELLRDRHADLVACDVTELTHPDCSTVEVLARLQLTARRLGRQLRVDGASSELHDLLALAGLCEVMGICAAYPSS